MPFACKQFGKHASDSNGYRRVHLVQKERFIGCSPRETNVTYLSNDLHWVVQSLLGVTHTFQQSYIVLYVDQETYRLTLTWGGDFLVHTNFFLNITNISLLQLITYILYVFLLIFVVYKTCRMCVFRRRKNMSLTLTLRMSCQFNKLRTA